MQVPSDQKIHISVSRSADAESMHRFLRDAGIEVNTVVRVVVESSRTDTRERCGPNALISERKCRSSEASMYVMDC